MKVEGDRRQMPGSCILGPGSATWLMGLVQAVFLRSSIILEILCASVIFPYSVTDLYNVRACLKTTCSPLRAHHGR